MNKHKILCINSECSEREHCLRQIYYNKMNDEEVISIITPRLCTGDSNCPYYLRQQPLAVAYGFTEMLTHLTRLQEDEFRRRMKETYHHNTYFTMRRGERPITPDEQLFIQNLVHDIAPGVRCFFDRTEELADEWE